MNYISALIMLVALTRAANSQIIYGGAGANFSFIHNSSLDYVIGRFNDRHGSTIKEPMDNFRFMPGEAVNIGLIGQTGISYDVTWSAARAEHSAETPDSTTEVRLVNNAVNVAFGITLPNESIFCPGLFFSFDFGYSKLSNRSAASENIDGTSYKKIVGGFQPGMSFMLNLMIAGKKKPVGFALRPYYRFVFYRPDFQELNSAINPGTAQQDESRDLEKSLDNFGVQAVIMITFRRNQ